MPNFTIELCLLDNQTQKKLVVVSDMTDYKAILKIASNKLNKKILSVHTESNAMYNQSSISNGDIFYCSTKYIKPTSSISIQKDDVIVSIVAVNSYIQDNAINQLETLKKLEGATHVFGMPDLHVGGGVPIGSVTITNGVIHPSLIGDDIGCGMSLFKTNLSNNVSQKNLKRMADLLNLEDGEDILHLFDNSVFEKYIDKIQTNFLTKSIGTIGRGNHFSELQIVEKIYNQDLATQYNITENNIYLTVHSGSRGFGDAILTAFNDKSININEYKDLHQIALTWARYNRDSIATRFCSQISDNCIEFEKIADMFHNFYEEKDDMVIHRKGSAPCEIGKLIVIPGSRGALTYVVNPLRSDITHGYSVSHGAGRKVSRGKAVELMEDSDDTGRQKKLNSEKFGENIVICENKDLFCEESPFAYKDIDVVVNDLVELGLVEIVMSLRPIITYKMRCSC